jgi:hypothetical protein
MTVIINAYFTPYRLAARKLEPVELTVELTNRGQIEKLMSMEIIPAQQLAFDRGGLKRKIVEKLGELKPNEKRTYYYHVWPRTIGREGSYPLVVMVLEHHLNYEYVTARYTKRLELATSI